MSSANKKRTRHSSSTKLSEYLGPGAELLPTEVPTLRDILRKGILIQEEKMLSEGGERKNFPINQMIEELTTSLYSQWEKSNFKFKPPVVSEIINVVRRLTKAWEKFTAISQRKETKESVVSTWESKLDILFDITICHCPITLCEETDSPPCQEGCGAAAHISCNCPAQVKLPVSDLAWLKGQREKIGSKSKYQIKDADIKYTKEVEKTAKRKFQDREALISQKQRADAEEQ